MPGLCAGRGAMRQERFADEQTEAGVPHGPELLLGWQPKGACALLTVVLRGLAELAHDIAGSLAAQTGFFVPHAPAQALLAEAVGAMRAIG